MKRGDVFILAWDFEARRCCGIQFAADNPIGPSPAPLPAGGPQAGISIFSPGNPTGLTSTAAFTMFGLGSTIAVTPLLSGRLLIIIAGAVANNTASDGGILQIRVGTGVAPANGAAVVGAITGVRVVMQGNANSAALQMPFTLVGVVTGLVLGVPIWIDVAGQVITGGTLSLSFNNPSACQVIEF